MVAIAAIATMALKRNGPQVAVDISKAFTVSPLDTTHAPKEGLYMQVPKGEFQNHPDLCPFGDDTTWRCLTSLYGLKQASAMYYDTFSKAIIRLYR